MITGRGPVAPAGRTIPARTWPVGPPDTAIHPPSTLGAAISPHCTSSTVLRPSTGPRSKRYGGFAVASAKAWAAGSRTGRGAVVPGMTASSDRVPRAGAGGDAGPDVRHPWRIPPDSVVHNLLVLY